MGSYNYGMVVNTNTLFTVFDYKHYGRFFWVYISAPLVAAIPAGYLARSHLRYIDEREEHKASIK